MYESIEIIIPAETAEEELARELPDVTPMPHSCNNSFNAKSFGALTSYILLNTI